MSDTTAELTQPTAGEKKVDGRTKAAKMQPKDIAAAKMGTEIPLTQNTMAAQTVLIDVAVFDAIMTKLEKMDARLQAVEAPFKKPMSNENVNLDDDNEVVAACRAILGSGEGNEFKITMKKHSPTSFMLEIVAPAHLRQQPDDTHNIVIPYAEGIEGAKMYAEKVKKYLVDKAVKAGVSYTA